MSIERFLGYAAAFDQAFESDEWFLVKSYFTEDAVYEVPGGAPFGKLVEGLENIISSFQTDVNLFDRKFDKRIVEFERPPYLEGTVVHAPWRAVFRKDGFPDLELTGTEQAHFEGDKMLRLVSVIDEAKGQEVLEWLSRYGQDM